MNDGATNGSLGEEKSERRHKLVRAAQARGTAKGNMIVGLILLALGASVAFHFRASGLGAEGSRLGAATEVHPQL